MRDDVPLRHPDFGRMYPCVCRLSRFESARKDRLMRFAAIPEAFSDASFDNFRIVHHELTPAKEAAMLFAEGQAPYRWLVLLGSPGWGKSHLAAAVLNARIEHPGWGKPGAWVGVPDLMRRLRGGFSDGSYEQTLEAFREIDLLVLDDLGAEYRKGGDAGSSWATEQLYLVLQRRMDRKLETVITSNEPPDHLGGRVADRLLNSRTGFAKVIVRQMPSFRSGVVWSA